MHDPMTVAFELRKPWRKYGSKGRNEFERDYRESWLTIWHVDPELHGSDDSCGWFTPPFSRETQEICKSLAHSEARDPWFFRLVAKSNEGPILCERLLFGAFVMVSRCLVNRGVIQRAVSVNQATRWAAEATHNGVDNFRNSLCFLSGYHSNSYHSDRLNTEEEDKFWREEQAKSFFGAIAGWILRDRRWWFQKPRWHVWHWKLQIHCVQAFKRWMFSRCDKCGKGFAYGASVCGYWSSGGPRWFKSERVYHADCAEPNQGADTQAKASTPA